MLEYYCDAALGIGGSSKWKAMFRFPIGKYFVNNWLIVWKDTFIMNWCDGVSIHGVTKLMHGNATWRCIKKGMYQNYIMN